MQEIPRKIIIVIFQYLFNIILKQKLWVLLKTLNKAILKKLILNSPKNYTPMLIKLQTQKKNFPKYQSKIKKIKNKRAYDTLGDATKRKNYDDYGMSGDQQDQYKN